MSRRMFFILVLAILLTGCAGAGVSQAAATEITVEATDFAYNPISVTVPAHQPVTLTLNNTGAVEHDFVVDKINVTDIQASDTGPPRIIRWVISPTMICIFLPGQEIQPS